MQELSSNQYQAIINFKPIRETLSQETELNPTREIWSTPNLQILLCAKIYPVKKFLLFHC